MILISDVDQAPPGQHCFIPECDEPPLHAIEFEEDGAARWWEFYCPWHAADIMAATERAA